MVPIAYPFYHLVSSIVSIL